jgi:hypothetical protein
MLNPFTPSLPGLTRQSIALQPRHSGMRPLGRRPGIQHHALFWIPGSLAQRKIDASINFVARLAPRNDGFRMDARVKPAHDDK